MGFLDYPFEFAEAILGFLRDPEGYVGTEGRALERAMKEYLVPDFDSLVFGKIRTFILTDQILNMHRPLILRCDA